MDPAAGLRRQLPRDVPPAQQLPQLQLQLPADPQPNPKAAAGDGLNSETPELNQDFLDSTAGIPDVIEIAGDPYQGTAAGETAAAGAAAGEPASVPPAALITPEMIKPALGAIWTTVGNVLARAGKDECYKVTAEERDGLADAWTPIAMYYLQQLGGLGMWLPPLALTAAIFGGKQIQADAHRAQLANMRKPASPASSPSSANGAAANPPYSAGEYVQDIA